MTKRAYIMNLIEFYNHKRYVLYDLEVRSRKANIVSAMYFFGGRRQMCEEIIVILKQELRKRANDHGNS